MNRILELLPRKRQNLLFSATLNENLESINKLVLRNPFVIKIESNDEPENIDLIKQLGYFVSEDRKGPLLRYLIKHNELKQVLVFTSSVYEAVRKVRVQERMRCHVSSQGSFPYLLQPISSLVELTSNFYHTLSITNYLVRRKITYIE